MNRLQGFRQGGSASVEVAPSASLPQSLKVMDGGIQSPKAKKKYFGTCEHCGKEDFSRKDAFERHIRSCMEKAEAVMVAKRNLGPRRAARLPPLTLTHRPETSALLAPLDHHAQV